MTLPKGISRVFPILATFFRPGILYDDITIREDQPRVVLPVLNLHILLLLLLLLTVLIRSSFSNL